MEILLDSSTDKVRSHMVLKGEIFKCKWRKHYQGEELVSEDSEKQLKESR